MHEWGTTSPPIIPTIRTHGAHRLVTDTYTPLYSPEGEIAGVIGILNDITERKVQEAAARAGNEKLRAVFESLVDGILVTNIEGKIVDANEASASLLGYPSRGALIGQYALTLVAEQEHERARLTMTDLDESRQARLLDTTMLRADGTTFHAEIHAVILRGEDQRAGYVVLIRDITERKAQEKALRTSLETLRGVFESLTDGITVTDMQGIITDSNEATLAMHAMLSREDLIGRSAFTLIHPSEHAAALENMQRTLDAGVSGICEYTMVRSDGSTFIGSLNAVLLRDSDGNPSGFVALTSDITERKAQAHRLAENEARLRFLTDHS